ncbi:putative structural protein [Drosophila suzukii associated ambidensovirus 1]|nr:putative structural protein [Drosophila suzukii associated ambidensovirus 1]
MSLPFKPPPYERSNWAGMNEGQRRYAMKQYNLALSRRGATAPILRPDQAPVNQEADFIDLFDLDLLGTPQEEQDNSLPNTQENEAADNFLNQVGARTPNRDMSEVSSSGTSLEAVAGSSKRDGDPVSGAPTKKAKTAKHSGSKLPGTSGNTDGMVGGGGGIPEGSIAIQNISRGLKSFSHSFTFQKRWKFLTFGVADQILNDAVSGGVAFDRWALTTSLASIPWEYAFFYISPAEWFRLRQFQGVFAKHARIKICQYNPRVAFQTADTTSTTATLNQNKFTRYGIGLRQNAALTCSDRDYEFSTDKPMQPTGFATTTHVSRRETLKDCMYGVANTASQAAHNSRIPAYATGQELGLSDYLTIYAPKDQDVGFVPYDQFCHELNSMDLIGQCMLEQDYSFEYAPLMPKWPAVMTQAMQDTQSTSVALPEGTKVAGLTTRTLSSAANADIPTWESDNSVRFLQTASSLIATNIDATTFTDSNRMYYQFPMEQNGVYHETNRKPTDYAHQQSVHVGIRAVPKLSTNANLTQADDWLDTQIYWTVEAELQVEATDPFTFIRGGPKINPAQMQLCEVVTSGTTTTPRVMSNDYAYTYGRRRLVENSKVI